LKLILRPGPKTAMVAFSSPQMPPTALPSWSTS